MSLELLDITQDYVIGSPYVTIKVTYKYAIENLYPLINRLEFQRNTLKKEYYERLKKDINDGCIMPSITIAFDDQKIFDEFETENAQELIETNIEKAFILDGIQRINTLHEAYVESEGKLDLSIPLYASIIISDSMNKLLYRMIVLNNGQKPMSTRHQIEILVGKTLSQFGTELDQIVVTEKDAKRNDGKKKLKSDVLSKAYLAYSSSSVDIDNQKIIEEKLDEIVSRKIVTSDIKNNNVDLFDLLNFILKINENAESNDDNLIPWLNNENNLIGIFAGISKNTEFIKYMDYEKMKDLIDNIDYALKIMNVSKIKVSKERRNVVSNFTENYETYSEPAIEKVEDFVYGGDKY
ncbi:hypothetical protein [Brochothrix thermosphacta]|uniref:DUF262 domain-containing protein n=5 Tax=Brochothrix thermosphacta TaxID=2756 RepID=A0A291KHV5_BROTH|nr:hypothetical protein [Brochothrix thermosphacta]ATF26669.1 hypothetical protein CNY62_09885 [Brochothrix thermosphacta]ATH86024.1 hypothetical protein CPF12_09555 [Brochothrix thermosphacta]MPQ29204.1 hypothetical protein [Brochothrix thermosphacta]